MVQRVVRLVRGETHIDFCREPVGLRRLAIAVVFLERLDLQRRFLSLVLGELQTLLRLIHVEPRQRRIASYHTLLVVERCTIRIGVELPASALEATLFATRKVLTQADRKLREVVATGTERFRGIDRQFFESAGYLGIG